MFSNSISVFICTPDLLFWFPTIAACSMFCRPHFHCDWYSTSTSRQPCVFFAGTHLWPGQRWVPLQGKLIDLYWKASLTYLMTVALTADPSALQNSASKFWRIKRQNQSQRTKANFPEQTLAPKSCNLIWKMCSPGWIWSTLAPNLVSLAPNLGVIAPKGCHLNQNVYRFE